MPPLPPIVPIEEVDRLLRELPPGSYHMDIADPVTPQIAPEGGYVFEYAGKVFTIWLRNPKPTAAR